jgi:hypothetical protein
MEAHLRRQREQRERELAAKKAAEQRWHQAPAFQGASFAGLRKDNSGRSWTAQKKEGRSASAPPARAAASASAGASTGAPATASARAGLSPVRVAGRKTGHVNLNKPEFNGHGFASRADLHKRAEQDARKAAEEALHKPRQTGGGRYSVFRSKAKSAPVPDLRRAPNVPAAATSFIKRVSRRISRRLSSPFLSEPSKAQPKQQLAAVQELPQDNGEEERAASGEHEDEHEQEEEKAESKSAEPEPAAEAPVEDKTTAALEEESSEAAVEAPPQEEEADEVKPEPLAAKH